MILPNSSKYISYFGGSDDPIPARYVFCISPLIAYFLKDSFASISLSPKTELTGAPKENEVF